MKIDKNFKIFASWLFIVILFLLLLIVLFFAPITTTFNVAVNTERIQYTTLDKNNSRIILMDAEVASLDNILVSNFEGNIELNSNVKVTIERISNGPISIILENELGESVGKIYNGDNGELFHEAADFLDIYIYDVAKKTEAGQTFIFSIEGDVNIGRSVNYEIFGESTALLRDGEIKMIGKSFFSNDNFEAGSVLLNLGDRLVFDDIQSKTFGFVTINENPCMKAAYRIASKQARVIKPGPQNEDNGYIISASSLNMLLNDRNTQGIIVLFAALIGLTTLLNGLVDSAKNIKNILIRIKNILNKNEK